MKSNQVQSNKSIIENKNKLFQSASDKQGWFRPVSKIGQGGLIRCLYESLQIVIEMNHWERPKWVIIDMDVKVESYLLQQLLQIYDRAQFSWHLKIPMILPSSIIILSAFFKLARGIGTHNLYDANPLSTQPSGSIYNNNIKKLSFNLIHRWVDHWMKLKKWFRGLLCTI